MVYLIDSCLFGDLNVKKETFVSNIYDKMFFEKINRRTTRSNEALWLILITKKRRCNKKPDKL